MEEIIASGEREEEREVLGEIECPIGKTRAVTAS